MRFLMCFGLKFTVLHLTSKPLDLYQSASTTGIFSAVVIEDCYNRLLKCVFPNLINTSILNLKYTPYARNHFRAVI